MGGVTRTNSVVILGGGPGGYEAALVAAHLGASVTVVDRDGIGGAAVLTDCVPSKTLIATADYLGGIEIAADLGVHLEDHEGDVATETVAELAAINARVLNLAAAQSADITARLEEVGGQVGLDRAGVDSAASSARGGSVDTWLNGGDLLGFTVGLHPVLGPGQAPVLEHQLTPPG